MTGKEITTKQKCEGREKNMRICKDEKTNKTADKFNNIT